MLLLLLAAVAVAPSASSINAPRRAFSQCIRKFETDSRAKKLPPADYSVAIKAACTAESAALRSALIAFDMGVGTKRSTATANAQSDVDDYYTTSDERYHEAAAPQ